MTCKLCNDTGEQRYWEGRWRDEKAENERLRALLRRWVDMKPLPETSMLMLESRDALRQTDE